MKKLLFTLALIITSIGLAVAQPYVYDVSGYVTNSNGGAVANQAINYSYSSSGITLTGVVYTNSNGYYAVGDSIMDTIVVYTLTTVCSGTTQTNSVVLSSMYPSDTSNFWGCGTGSGCTASTSQTQTGQGNYNISATSNGVAPFVYAWSNGSTSSSINVQPTSTSTYCVTVTDANGCSSSSCQTITIASANCYAQFTYSVSGNTISVTNQSSGAGLAMSYNWYLSNGTTSTAANPTFSVNGGGTYNLMLIIQTANCTDSTSLNITVASAPCSVTISQTSTAWNTYQFAANTSSTGMNFNWNFGDGSNSSLQNPSHTYATAGTYNVELGMYGSNCVDSAFLTLVITQPAPANSVSGNIYTANTLASNATVYLIEFDSTMAGLTLTAIDSMTTTTGSYSFSSVPSGSYLVKAALNSTDPNYASYMPTYHTSSMYWYSASMVFTNSTAGVNGADIYMIGGTNAGGPGFIGGAVSQGANKMDGIGDPIEDVLVFLLDANGNLVDYTYSTANGTFEFDNLALGTYTVYAEIAGLNTTSLDVTLTQSTINNNGIYVKVNSNSVVVEQGAPQAVTELTANNVSIYPIPVSNVLYVAINNDGFSAAKYSIVDVQGRTVAAGNGIANGTNTLDVTSLSAGVYILKIEGIAPQRFVK